MSNLPHIHFYYANQLQSNNNSFNQTNNIEYYENYKEGYNNYIKGYKNTAEDVFVMFYAPWCGHCHQTKPEVQNTLGGIATEYNDYQSGNFKKHKGKIAIVMINGDDHPELSQQFGVQGYPTFKYLRGVSDRSKLQAANIVDYQGGRSRDDFEGFLNIKEQFSGGDDWRMIKDITKNRDAAANAITSPSLAPCPSSDIAKAWITACEGNSICKNNCVKAMAVASKEDPTYCPDTWETICNSSKGISSDWDGCQCNWNGTACNPTLPKAVGICAYGAWQLDCSNACWKDLEKDKSLNNQAKTVRKITNNGDDWQYWATLCPQGAAPSKQDTQGPAAMTKLAQSPGIIDICHTAGMGTGTGNPTFSPCPSSLTPMNSCPTLPPSASGQN